jgi:hypothetical protein
MFNIRAGLSQPDLVLLIIAKHFSYAGKEEFNFAMAEHEYVRFARTELAASGRTKWSGATLQTVSTADETRSPQASKILPSCLNMIRLGNTCYRSV